MTKSEIKQYEFSFIYLFSIIQRECLDLWDSTDRYFLTDLNIDQKITKLESAKLLIVYNKCDKNYKYTNSDYGIKEARKLYKKHITKEIKND